MSRVGGPGSLFRCSSSDEKKESTGKMGLLLNMPPKGLVHKASLLTYASFASWMREREGEEGRRGFFLFLRDLPSLISFFFYWTLTTDRPFIVVDGGQLKEGGKEGALTKDGGDMREREASTKYALWRGGRGEG